MTQSASWFVEDTSAARLQASPEGVRRFVESRQPLLTLHGHVHESARLTGRWRDKIGQTHMFTAAHDGPELALVQFDPDELENAERDLL